MTREEAAQSIYGLILSAEDEDGPCIFSDQIEALEMGIEALKQPEQKNGYWIGRPIAGYTTVRCSVCTEMFFENKGRWNFCPNCGAKMEGEQ